MTRDRRWYATIAAVLVLLAVVACGPLGGGEMPEATEAPLPAETPVDPGTGAGRCGDSVCDEMEQQNPALCPQDCVTPPPAPSPAEPPAVEGRCGDGTCDGPENAQNCPQDCGPLEVSPADTPILPAVASDRPLYVTIYYHVEPNPQLFEAVEPGYFEAVSLSLREMSSSLAEIGVHATFCFAWLYNDLVYCRNHDPQTGEIVNSPQDTGIETYEQIIADGHELAYHTHPPYSIKEGKVTYYARPNSTCQDYDTSDMHRWSGMTAGYYVSFEPGVYQFDDPNDPWHGQFIWERTSETLFWIADYLGVTIRHTNGGQKPMLDIMNKYGSGINHEHSMQQLRSLMNTGFDLISPEVMSHFNPEYEPMGTFWADSSTGYVTYLGPEANLQVYYPDIKGGAYRECREHFPGLNLHARA